jgi:beta-1,4-N-acetylglucosaminyltransferase
VSSGPEDGVATAATRVAAGLTDGPIDVLLVCSTGGHLLQLHMLRQAWQGRRVVWVTFDKSDSRSLLGDDAVVFAHGPTNRSLTKLALNVGLAVRVIRRTRPAVIVSTCAGVVVPFAWIGRLLGARIVYVESLTRIDKPSLTLRLIAPVTHRVYVQWPELARVVRGASYDGSVVGSR